MTVQTNAGTSLQVSIAAPATHDAAGFAALTFTNVGEIVSTGEKGGAAALVTHSHHLISALLKSSKARLTYGSYAVSLGLDLSDAGQVILDGLAVGANIDVVASFKETKQNGDIEYYRAIVMTYTRVGGTIDAIIGSNATLELTDSIIDA